MIIRLTCIISLLLFVTQCLSTRHWMAGHLLGVNVAGSAESGLSSSSALPGRHSRQGEYILEENLMPVYTYPLSPEQRVEAMKKIRAAGLDRAQSRDIVYVPVSPAKPVSKKAGGHYVKYDVKTGAPKEVVVLKD